MAIKDIVLPATASKENLLDNTIKMKLFLCLSVIGMEYISVGYIWNDTRKDLHVSSTQFKHLSIMILVIIYYMRFLVLYRVFIFNSWWFWSKREVNTHSNSLLCCKRFQVDKHEFFVLMCINRPINRSWTFLQYSVSFVNTFTCMKFSKFLLEYV